MAVEAAAGTVTSAGAAVVLLLAAVAKVRRPRETEIAWEQHRVLPVRRIAAVVRLVTGVELGLGILLLVPAASAAAALGATGLFLGYAAYLIAALRSGATGGCACFGLDRSTSITSVHVWRAAAFALLAALSAAAGARTEDVLAYAVGVMVGVSCLLVSTIWIMVVDTVRLRDPA